MYYLKLEQLKQEWIKSKLLAMVKPHKIQEFTFIAGVHAKQYSHLRGQFGVFSQHEMQSSIRANENWYLILNS